MDINALSFISYAVCTAATVQTAMAGHVEHKQTNILFCIADDAGHMSAYGTPWLNTPAFDRVAGEGILLITLILVMPSRRLRGRLSLPDVIRGN